jgi:hypothetical protein
VWRLSTGLQLDYTFPVTVNLLDTFLILSTVDIVSFFFLTLVIFTKFWSLGLDHEITDQSLITITVFYASLPAPSVKDDTNKLYSVVFALI